MGVYVFNTDVLVRTVSEDARRESAHDFGRNIIPDLVERGRVFAYNFKHGNRNSAVYWRDIGLLDTYWEANMDLVSDTPEFGLYDTDWPIRTYQEPYPPTRIELGGGMSDRPATANAVISGGCVVTDAQVDRCVLSYGARVESGARVSESILMEGVVVGSGATVHRAIIDKDVTIPSGCRIGLDHERDQRLFTLTPNGVVVVPKGLPVEP
jgi:glucose-1-phosphate adenylyltransferase